MNQANYDHMISERQKVINLRIEQELKTDLLSPPQEFIEFYLWKLENEWVWKSSKGERSQYIRNALRELAERI